MKKIFVSILLSTLLLGVIPVAAESDKNPKSENDKGPLTKITFIHYKKNPAKPDGFVKPSKSSCYGFLSRGAKWKTVEDYYVNPTGSLTEENLVFNAVNASVSEWEGYGGDIFGVGAINYDLKDNGGSMDGNNVAFFDVYSDSNVIAVSTIWGYFYGAPNTRQIVEWDIQFNTSFEWGDAEIDGTLMDIQNIATHELGHSAGLADLYTTSCSAETMYGYSIEGEISKRDLNAGDILGIQILY